MKTNTTITDSAKNTLKLEADSIAKLVEFIDDEFVQIVNLILQSSGRVIVTGIGKSANIANKIVATLNSTGTPAIFMHAADAIHGDLGIVLKDDVVICISKSGTSPEIKVLVPLVKSMGNPLIAMSGNMTSYLAEKSDYVLNTTVEKEACPNDLAPTSSTTAQLAMGDALAVALMECHGFSANDFAKNHPGGALGKKMFLKLGDIVDSKKQPQVALDTFVKDIILEISSGRLGATAVIDNGHIVGMITDGDLRRMLQSTEDFSSLTAKDIMSSSPVTLSVNDLAVKGFQVMEKNNITQVLLTDDKIYAGIVHLHDILKEGIY